MNCIEFRLQCRRIFGAGALNNPSKRVKSDPKGEDDWLRNEGGGRGRGGENTPARTPCLFAEPVHWMDGGFDWCGKLHFD